MKFEQLYTPHTGVGTGGGGAIGVGLKFKKCKQTEDKSTFLECCMINCCAHVNYRTIIIVFSTPNDPLQKFLPTCKNIESSEI